MCHQLLVIFTAECGGCVWTEAWRATAGLGPVPLPLWPLQGRGQPALTGETVMPWNHNTEATLNSALHTTDSLLAQQSKEQAMRWNILSLNLEGDLYDQSPSSEISSTTACAVQKVKKLFNMDGCCMNACKTQAAHLSHRSPPQLPETEFSVLLGTLPKARVTLVHPAQASTKLCGNPYAYPSKILCCFPATQAIFTQNKQQLDKPFRFWALLFVT